MTKKQEKEKQESLGVLRKYLAPGDTVHTVLRHVSRSGMSRAIDVVKLDAGESRYLSYHAARAIGASMSKAHEGITVGGCGMDMGFHVAYELSYALFPEGFGCIGEHCPSNDHSNGDRDYTPHEDGPDGACHWHREGGYALKHRWI